MTAPASVRLSRTLVWHRPVPLQPVWRLIWLDFENGKPVGLGAVMRVPAAGGKCVEWRGAGRIPASIPAGNPIWKRDRRWVETSRDDALAKVEEWVDRHSLQLLGTVSTKYVTILEWDSDL